MPNRVSLSWVTADVCINRRSAVKTKESLALVSYYSGCNVLSLFTIEMANRHFIVCERIKNERNAKGKGVGANEKKVYF